MALVKSKLKNDIKQIFVTLRTYDGTDGNTQEDAIEKMATDLANAIDLYIRSATVTTPINTSVVGTANGGNILYPVTGNGIGSGTGTIS